MAVKPTRLADLAAQLGRSVEGDGDFVIEGVGSIEDAGPGDLGFVGSEKWAAGLASSKLGAVILPEGLDPQGRPAIRSPAPRLDFARAVGILHPAAEPSAGVDPSAVVAPDAHLDPSAAVGPRAVVGAGCRVGARSVLHANVTLYADVEIGDDCIVHGGCVLREGTRLGHRVILQPGVILGGDGFGYEGNERGELERVPQVGVVVLEDDVEIGANSTVDRAALGETRIRSGAKIDNLVMVAHNVQIGRGAVLVAQAGIAGSARIGDGAVVMSQAGVADHADVGDGATIGTRAGVFGTIEPGEAVWGTGVRWGLKEYFRAHSALKRLPDALRRLSRLEKRFEKTLGEQAAGDGDDGGD